MSDFSGTVWLVIIGSVVAFLAVTTAVFFIAKPKRVLELAWLATPALILVTLVGWSQRVLGSDVRSAAGEPEVVVDVTGKMFVWEVKHTLPDGRVVDTLNRIHVPAGKTAEIRLRSADVAHGFWIPQLGVKEDALPGELRTFRIRATQTGEFNIVCSELCGNSHYAMRGFVHVDSPDAFQAFVADTGGETR